MSGKRPASAASSSPMPIKWAAGLIAALVAYAVLQPVLNKQLGWQLPSLATMQLGDQPAQDEQAPLPERAATPVDSTAGQSTQTRQSSQSRNDSEPDKRQPPTAAENAEASLRYGFLRETAPDDFLSPAGLRYTRGSAEGHRLKHIERHLIDDPSRPGKHGVFDGDMGQVLRWIDEAYELATGGAPGSSHKVEDGRTVYEARFSRSIGFIGGRDGRRENNPPARRLRLVVEGTKVITAFPF